MNSTTSESPPPSHPPQQPARWTFGAKLTVVIIVVLLVQRFIYMLMHFSATFEMPSPNARLAEARLERLALWVIAIDLAAVAVVLILRKTRKPVAAGLIAIGIVCIAYSFTLPIGKLEAEVNAHYTLFIDVCPNKHYGRKDYFVHCESVEPFYWELLDGDGNAVALQESAERGYYSEQPGTNGPYQIRVRFSESDLEIQYPPQLSLLYQVSPAPIMEGDIFVFEIDTIRDGERIHLKWEYPQTESD